MIYTLEEIAHRVRPVAEKYHLRAVYVFGSYARGEAQEDSDVDLLIDDTGSGLRGLAYGGLCYDLEDVLEKRISFVLVGSLEGPCRVKSDTYFRENVAENGGEFMLSPDLQRVAHIREYCVNIQDNLARFGATFEQFLSDLAFQQSVAFCILQIGELSNGLSEEYRQSTDTDVQWNAIRGLRNIVAHAYGSIKLDILWDTIITDVPALKQFCEDQLANAE